MIFLSLINQQGGCFCCWCLLLAFVGFAPCFGGSEPNLTPRGQESPARLLLPGCFPGILFTGELWEFLSFTERYPSIISNILLFGLTSALGQVGALRWGQGSGTGFWVGFPSLGGNSQGICGCPVPGRVPGQVGAPWDWGRRPWMRSKAPPAHPRMPQTHFSPGRAGI